MTRPKQTDPVPTLQELRAARGATPSLWRRMRRWIIAGGVVVLLILFGFIGLPPIVKAQAVKQLSQRLGREVTIEKLSINPLVFSATVEGFRIAEAEVSKGEFAGWERLHVNLNSWPLLVGSVRFSEIDLIGFHARVAKGEEGGFNFDDILKKLVEGEAPADSAAEGAGGGEIPSITIDKLVVSGARVGFEDESLERPYSAEIGPLAFTLHDFHTEGDPNAPYSFEAVTAAGEQIAWKGTVSAVPVRSHGELRLANVDLARLAPYYHKFIKGDVRSAFLDVAGEYGFELRPEGPVLTLESGEFTLREVRFGAAGEAHDALALKKLAVSGVKADAVARTAAIDKISVEGLEAKVVRDATGVDLLRLLEAPDAQATVATQVAGEAGSAASAGLPKVTLGELSISGVKLEAVDLTTPRRAEHRVENVVLTLRELDSTNLAKQVPLTLEVSLPKEGRVTITGLVSAQPLSADLDVALEGVLFANASPYLEPYANVRLADGAIRARGKAGLRDGAASFAGEFGIAGFHAVDGKLAADFLRWADFSITGIRATTQPLALHVEEIRFVEPAATVRVEEDGSLSIAQAAGASGAKVDDAAGEVKGAGSTVPAGLPPVTIGRFAFERAAFRFEDRSIKPAARGGITDFTGAITGLTSEALGRADVDLRGRVDGVAPVAITGKLNPLGTPAFVDLTVDFKGIDLQPGAGPYVGKFVGRELARGNLSLAIRAKLDERRLDTNNVVTLDQFFLGAKTNSPEATNLPVGLALALLRDTEGKIVVDLPVKGSLDDPNFKIGRVVVRVLVNILSKAATSPFSLLGAAFGGGGDELGWQEFAPGVATADEAGIKKLETVAKALNARPALSLEIVGAYDPVADGAALRLEKLERVLRAKIWEERRATDPATPPPDQLEISAEARAAMVARLYADAFPAGSAELASAEATTTTERVEADVNPAVAVNEPQSGERRLRRAVGRLPRFNNRPAEVIATAEPQVVFSLPQESEAAPAAPAKDASAAEEPAAPAIPVMTTTQMELKLAADILLPETDLQAVGEARARGLRAWLLETGKVPAERVFLGPLTPGSTRVNLNLR